MKSNEADDYYPLKSYQTLKAPRSPKHPPIDSVDSGRSNIYAETPPKVKSSMQTRDYVAARQQRPSAPVRTDSARSVASTTLSSMSSRSTTPSNSFRQDPRTLTSSPASINNELSEHKPKSIYDIESAILYNNHKCLNMITSGYSSALQSVKEDECLTVDANNNHTHSKLTKVNRPARNLLSRRRQSPIDFLSELFG